MSRYMVWVQTESSEGWGCSLCEWVIAASEIETTVAALRYNRAAQRAFDVHECHRYGRGNAFSATPNDNSRFAA